MKRTFSAGELEILGGGFRRLEERAARLSVPGIVDGASFVVERRAGRPVRIERIVWCGAAEPELLRLGQKRTETRMPW